MSSSIVEEAVRLLSEPVREPIAKLSLLRQAFLFAEFAKIAYYQPSAVYEAVTAIGFDRYEYFDRDGAQAYLFANRHDCVIVCRGTEPHEWNDIKADVNAVSVVAETVGRVHRGFKREVDDLWPRLEQALKENQQPLWFAGHSLGGAMATISAARCKLSEIPSNPEGLFTYGSPRVGNNRYINFVRVPHFRWVNNNDIVCWVPPRWMGYCHTGQEFYFDYKGRLSKLTRWRRFRDRFHGVVAGIRQGKIDFFADHSMLKYIEVIQKAIEDERNGRTNLGIARRSG